MALISLGLPELETILLITQNEYKKELLKFRQEKNCNSYINVRKLEHIIKLISINIECEKDELALKKLFHREVIIK